jgi:transposase
MAKNKALNREQIRLLLHFQWLKGVFYADAMRAINNAYGAKTVGRTTAYDWYKKFEVEGMQLKDKIDLDGRVKLTEKL